MREKTVEQKLVKAVKAAGGICPNGQRLDLMACRIGSCFCRAGGWDLWK